MLSLYKHTIVFGTTNVRSCTATTAKSVGILACRLAKARILLVQVLRTRMTNTTTYRYLTQSVLNRQNFVLVANTVLLASPVLRFGSAI